MFMYITVKEINLNQLIWSELVFVLFCIFFDNHIIRVIDHIVKGIKHDKVCSYRQIINN